MAKKPAKPPTQAEVAATAKRAAARVAARKAAAPAAKVGPPEAPIGKMAQEPQASEAQLAAGPHRPEPAKPVRNDPGSRPFVPAKARANARIKVRATQTGYYDEIRRRTGDVFTLRSAKDFSHTWMEMVDGSTPEKITTGQEEIRRIHDEQQSFVMAGGKRGTGAADPLGAEDE